MRYFKVLLGFHGGAYEGWQDQGKGRTVQEVVERALARILKQKVSVLSSSRTDSGVHALSMPAHFRAATNLPADKLRDALNFYLPKDIVVHSVTETDAKFHARFHAKSKLYRYTIWNDRTRPLFDAPFALWVSGALDVPAMKKAAARFIGRHDFAAFWDRAGDEPKGTVRRVRRVSVTAKKPRVTIDVEGDGFLRHMVRVIVGTLLEVGRGKLKPSDIPGIIRSKDRKTAGPTAKAHGLMLIKVRY